MGDESKLRRLSINVGLTLLSVLFGLLLCELIVRVLGDAALPVDAGMMWDHWTNHTNDWKSWGGEYNR